MRDGALALLLLLPLTAAAAPNLTKEAEGAAQEAFQTVKTPGRRWIFGLSQPFPAAWPPDGSGLVAIYAYGWSIDGISDAQRQGSVWAMATVDVRDGKLVRFERLRGRFHDAGTAGVEPMSRELRDWLPEWGAFEAALKRLVLRKGEPETLDPSLRKGYCYSLNRGNASLGAQIRPFQIDFIARLDCQREDSGPDAALTQTEMNDWDCAEYKKDDQAMKDVYQRIVEDPAYAADKEFLASLDRAQKLWISYRSAELAAIFPGASNGSDARARWGSVYPTCSCRELGALTRQRVAALQRWLERGHGQEGDEVCHGSEKR